MLPPSLRSYGGTGAGLRAKVMDFLSRCTQGSPRLLPPSLRYDAASGQPLGFVLRPRWGRGCDGRPEDDELDEKKNVTLVISDPISPLGCFYFLIGVNYSLLKIVRSVEGCARVNKKCQGGFGDSYSLLKVNSQRYFHYAVVNIFRDPWVML